MDTRTPESLLFEAEYWHQIQTELLGLLDGIGGVAAVIAASATASIEMAVYGLAVPELVTPLEESTAGLAAAMEKLREIQTRVIAIGELVGGRIVALREEGFPTSTEGGE